MHNSFGTMFAIRTGEVFYFIMLTLAIHKCPKPCHAHIIYAILGVDSFWMTEEDQVMYNARSKEERIEPSAVPRKTQDKSTTSEVAAYQDLRRIQKQNFDLVKEKQAS
jgi:hypothetical protein